MKLWSLRRSLIIGINLAVILVLAITAWETYRDILHELDEVFDAQLAQTAKSIAAFYSPASDSDIKPITVAISDYPDSGEDDLDSERGPSGHKYEAKIGYQVFNDDEALMAQTSQQHMPILSHLAAGYHVAVHDQQTWLIFSYFSASKQIWVRTFQREDVRSELSGYLASEQLYSLLLMWVPISLIIVFIVHLVLKPVNRFADDLSARALENLAPIDAELPQELVPIKHSINQLLVQVDTFSRREKRFIADASHELRTPLSAIQVHAENVVHADSLGDAKQSGQAIFQAVERMSHLVNQLLHLNRLDSSQYTAEFQLVELSKLIRAAIDALPSNQVEKYQWQIDSEPMKLRCNEILMASALTNVLSNAIKFAPVDSLIAISAQLRDGLISIRITDQGSGVPDEVVKRMGERFYRYQGHATTSGSGLGLSITSKIVQLHQGRISFANLQPQGFCVTIELPAR